MKIAPFEADASAGVAHIAVEGVAKHFDHAKGRVYALDDCSMSVARGEFVSLIGPSGCGKSTLLRLIGGLMQPDEGTVLIDGVNPRVGRREKQFGFVPQVPALLPWRTVMQNVKLLQQVNRRGGRKLRSEVDAGELLDAVGLAGFHDSLPKELSGGMQQRVGLVRAFALGSPTLLMDEPFAALDEITRASMRYQLLNIWEKTGKTVLFVTHSIAEAVMLSDRILVLASRPGRITTEVHVDLPRPRGEEMEDTPEFLHLVAAVRSGLREGWGH